MESSSALLTGCDWGWGNMVAIFHPLSDELGGLVESDPQSHAGSKNEPDRSWRWMVAIAVAVGLFAWITR
jgi:hypothetical protein